MLNNVPYSDLPTGISPRVWEDILKKIENQRKEIQFWREKYGLYDYYNKTFIPEACRCCHQEKGKPHTDNCVFEY